MNELNGSNGLEGTKKCPYCAETIKLEAVKCRYCGSHIGGDPLRDEWYRLNQGRKLGGVCAGLSHHFGISVTPIRLAFVIGTLFSFVGVLIYIVLWIILPERNLGDTWR